MTVDRFGIFLAEKFYVWTNQKRNNFIEINSLPIKTEYVVKYTSLYFF